MTDITSDKVIIDIGSISIGSKNNLAIDPNGHIAGKPLGLSDLEAIKPNIEQTPRAKRNKLKPVRFANHTPLEGYYNDGHGNLYSVARLIDMCKDLEPFDAPLQAFDLSSPIWQDYSIFDLAFHVKAVNDADLSYPIILDWNGSIADGRHRLIKALVLGHTTIKCVRMYWKPEADKHI